MIQAEWAGPLLRAGGALIVLLAGWLASRLAARLVYGAAHRARLDERVSASMQGRKAVSVEWILAAGTAAIIMLFTLVGFFETVGLGIVTEPLNGLLATLFAFAPRLLAAAGLGLLAWVSAIVVRAVVRHTPLPRRLQGVEAPTLMDTLGEAAFYFVVLLFLPAILGALGLDAMLTPVVLMLDKALAFLPNLLSAAVILAIGVVVARLLRTIVQTATIAAGADGWSERQHLPGRLSTVLSTMVYALVLIPVVTAALNALGLDSVTGPLSNVLNKILLALPNLLAATVVLGVGYALARLVAVLATTILQGLGFDSLPARLGLPWQASVQPTGVAGNIMVAAMMLFAGMEAARLLGFDALAGLLVDFTVFAGHVALGLIILALGLYVANMAAVMLGGRANALQAGAARTAILVLAAAMALRQMGIANDIINLAFGLALAAVALAFGLAFGLGGRDAAGRIASQWVDSIRKPTPEVRAEQPTVEEVAHPELRLKK